MPVTISFPELDGTTGALELDVVVREVHTSSADITEHAVESGANVSDHVRPQQDRLSLEGWVSNTPIRQPGSHMDGARGEVAKVDLSPDAPGRAATVLQFAGDFDRARTVYDELRRLIRQGIVCGIHTSLRDYDDMVLAMAETPREAGNGNALEVKVDAKQIRIVSSETIAASERPREPRGRRRRSRGSQPTTPATTPQRDQQSALHRAAFGDRGGTGGFAGRLPGWSG